MPAINVPPRELAALVASRRASLVIGFDVDGVLAPIVERADRATLLPGVAPRLAEIAERLIVAVVSGRSVDDLMTRYGFPPEIVIIGSHGLEVGGHHGIDLDATEQVRLDQLSQFADSAAAAAGTGAWVEHKPASVVLHVREAHGDLGARAVDQLEGDAAAVDGAHVKRGHQVLELMTRPTSKATAMEALRARHDAQTMVFLGDDLTDEEVFATMLPGDIGIRVGPGETVASHRLGDPHEVLDFLHHLVHLLDDPA